MDVGEFNALPAGDARSLVAGCLGVPRWVDEVVAGRPYADRAALRKQAPRLGARAHRRRAGGRPVPPPPDRRAAATGDDAEARHSRAEQSGVDGPSTRTRLREANAAYEARFGHVFLIRAAGRSSDEILAELERRLGNDDATERAETVTALRDIALLRLEQVVA